jgi:hypothetical protein
VDSDGPAIASKEVLHLKQVPAKTAKTSVLNISKA